MKDYIVIPINDNVEEVEEYIKSLGYKNKGFKWNDRWRHIADCCYALNGSYEFHLHLGDYDHRAKLVNVPNSIGENQFQKGELVAVRDHDNQAWMLGKFRQEVNGEYYVHIKGWNASYYMQQCKKISEL